ncbi:hypothetical protein [Mycobacterium sp. Root265]|uniref:hypothetical protein n=1 Tax=Mycobacterium sp. Root265 TaxID=1736504 RepID=UPI0012E3425D|nr:hypothetical protein [Mycobacterium sp. Root265]
MYWLGAGGAIALAGLCTLGFIPNVRWQRRVYWASWLFGAALMACAFIEPGWRMVGVVLAVCLAAAACFAYFRTSYLKIGGRIYSFWIARTQPDPLPDGSPAPPVIPPPDSYRGQVTADAQWWLMAVASVCAGVSALVLGMSGATLGVAALPVVLLAGTGFIDSYDGFPIARRRWVQLALIVVSSIPVFLLPPIAYLIGYYLDGPRRRS